MYPYTRMYVYIYTYTYAHMYIYTSIYMYTYMHIHIHTHTHVYIYISLSKFWNGSSRFNRPNLWENRGIGVPGARRDVLTTRPAALAGAREGRGERGFEG